MGFFSSLGGIVGPLGGAAVGAVLGGPAGAMAGAVAGGSVTSALSQSDTNKMQMELAGRQTQFQADMSNTAHQREVADLRAAGLNPILSARYGGSSTPSGSMAQLVNPYKDLPSGINSASQTYSDRKLNEVQVENVRAQTLANSANAQKTFNESNGIVIENAIRTQRLKQIMASTKVRSGAYGSIIQGARDWSEILRGVPGLNY